MFDFLPSLTDFFVNTFETILSWFDPLFIWCLQQLPEVGPDCYLKPLPVPPASDSLVVMFWDTLNWVLPLNMVLGLFTAMSLYYLITFILFPILRWLKVVK